MDSLRIFHDGKMVYDGSPQDDPQVIFQAIGVENDPALRSLIGGMIANMDGATPKPASFLPTLDGEDGSDCDDCPFYELCHDMQMPRTDGNCDEGRMVQNYLPGMGPADDVVEALTDANEVLAQKVAALRKEFLNEVDEADAIDAKLAFSKALLHAFIDLI